MSALALRAGTLQTTLVDGRLGGVFVAGHEVWHGLHFLLRDPHWRTPACRLGQPRHEARESGWRVVVDGGFDTAPEVALRLTIDDDDGTLRFTGEARASGDIEVNRLGLCLLHPLAAAGRAVEVVHGDGRRSRSTLPGDLIPPWPPFTAIAALRHEFAPGCWAGAAFEGADFEFEDQRNNADASFKTYSRSNFMPRPYRLRAGQRLRQRVTLRVEAVPDAPPLPAGAARAERPLRVGVELLPSDLADTRAASARLSALRPGHVHVSVDVGDVDALRTEALAAVLRSAPMALRLDVTGVARDTAAAALSRLAARLGAAGIAVADLAVFPTSHEAVAAARAAFPQARVGGGTPDFFVQLNRAEDLPPLDFLSFTVCPIVHQADDATVMRSAASVDAMLATLAARHPGVPVQIGPSTIAARRSPLGELATSDGTRPVPLAGVDPRDPGPFGADWIEAHVAAARQAGAQAVTVARLAWCAPGSPVGERLVQLLRSARG